MNLQRTIGSRTAAELRREGGYSQFAWLYNGAADLLDRTRETTLNEYQELAARTDLGNDIPLEEMQKCFAMGLAGEAGETADNIKKYFWHKRPLDRDLLVKELGNTLWYLAMLAKKFDITLEQVAAANIAKLAKRYPNGFVIGGGNR